MFSCCVPVCRRRGLKRGSDESVFRRARHWIRALPRRRLWPFAQRHPESSTYVKTEQQVVEEDPRALGSSEGPVSHTTEGQNQPEVCVANRGSEEPGPVDGQQEPPPPKPPRLPRPHPPKPPRPNKPPTSKPLSPNTRMAIFNKVLERHARISNTIREDLEPREAEPKAPAQEAEAAPPETPEVSPKEQDAELGASPPPELSPPPAASPAAAEEPGPAPDQTEAPPMPNEEPSLEPVLVPPSEEELPVEGPAQGPLVECMPFSPLAICDPDYPGG
ncbi:uncharacterized protein [Myotis yumanensis]|uniref:uncharacterized protein n=1 Tax=Myotis yumanensis TaxID=159337 RepID=UPI0038D3EFAF